MKKTFRKILNESLKRLRQHKEKSKIFKFSHFKEDFVITEQEEREGGYFGALNFKPSLSVG